MISVIHSLWFSSLQETFEGWREVLLIWNWKSTCFAYIICIRKTHFCLLSNQVYRRFRIPPLLCTKTNNYALYSFEHWTLHIGQSVLSSIKINRIKCRIFVMLFPYSYFMRICIVPFYCYVCISGILSFSTE